MRHRAKTVFKNPLWAESMKTMKDETRDKEVSYSSNKYESYNRVLSISFYFQYFNTSLPFFLFIAATYHLLLTFSFIPQI